jgi:dihydrolipoamide dehydrogenase
LLVVGGGYIGLELGSMYAALGSRVTLVEMTDRLIAEVDRDLLRILKRELDRRFEAINTRCKVAEIEERDNDVRVAIEGEESYEDQYDRVLIAIGRQPRTEGLDLDRTDAALDDRGFIQVNQHLQTDDPHLYAVGDAVAQPMLAHKAMQEGKIAAEHIAGQPAVYDARAIPAVIYTFPEVAWCGMTEQEAKNQGRDVTVSRFKWTASGRAASLGLKDGLTKLVIDPQTDQVLGMGITGKDAGELIAEGVLAVEMGAVVEDLARTVHPHPTLSEGVFEAAGAYAGFPTHVLPIK